MKFHYVLTWMVLCRSALAAGVSQGEPAPFMMRATVAERVIEGQPLAWGSGQMLLLGRDGVLHEFDPLKAKGAERFGDRFVGYSTSEMKSRLREEFDRTYDISTSAHFIVVHPRDRGREWADRFESLYRSFTHYVSVRGFEPTAPATPLTAVVFRNQDEYFRHGANNGTLLMPGTLGHYDPASNRIFLFDSRRSESDWAETAATIIHEATHQVAYNCGVHRRFAEQPRWAVEGLAMMFEVPGLWNQAAVRQQVDRINRQRLTHFRMDADARPADWLTRLAATDARFETDALSAYAEAWLVSFYFCETRPQEYCEYLSRVAAREPFSKYPPLERMTDFTTAFGSDLELLTAQIGRFVDALP